jgi:hypothetical protein
MHGVDHTRRHPTSRSSGHRVPDLCVTIPDPLHQVSYSCHDPHHCLLCRTCYLHTTRQANTILHTNKGNVAEPRKCPEFKFQHRRVNDSSHIKSRYWPLDFSPWNSSWFFNTRESGCSDPLACSIVCTWKLSHGFIVSTWCPSIFSWLAFTFFEEDVFLEVFVHLLEVSFCWLVLPLLGVEWFLLVPPLDKAC